MKINFIKSLRIIILGLIISLTVGYVFAWNAPTRTPFGENTSAPINTSSDPQAKGGSVLAVTPPLLDIQGAVYSTGLYINNFFEIASFGSPLTVKNLNESSNPGAVFPAPICFDTDGSLTLCSSSPELTTTAISAITQTTATTGGNVTSDGGAPVTARGVVWSTSTNPTVALTTKTSNGTGTGSFVSNLTGLTPNTMYYAKAYAINSIGTGYGNQVAFTTSAAALPLVTTTAISAITQTTATTGGNVTSDGGAPVTARGVVWSTSTNPTVALTTKTSNGTGTGSFVSNLTGLTSGTTYYVRAYATSSAGTNYGNQVTFSTTTPTYPDLTATIPNYSSTLPGLINFSGTISNIGNASTGAGTFTNLFQVSSSSSFSNPTNTAIVGMGTIAALGSAPITTPNINFAVGTYYVRFCADNNASFVGTIAESAENNNCGPSRILGVAVAVVPPTVTTNSISSITSTTATSGGGITSDGGNYITEKGVAYGTSTNPTISGSHTTDGNSSGSFISSLSGLTPNTTYYVRAYATNMSGTGYGNQVTFTTSAAALPSVTTTAISAITQTTATTGGTVTSAGAFPVTARGVVYGNSPNPTVPAWDHTINGTGTGTFTSNLTGLMSGITYYARAYATSSAGTSYGGQVIFTTNSTPLVTTTAISAITQTTATTGGNVTSDGGAPVTARGVVWSTSTNPTVALTTKTSNGTGTGSFVSNLTGLTPNTMYYVRAYATNSLGTSYGSQVTFPTDNLFTLIVNKDGPGSSGNITSTPSGINCGSSCSAAYLDSTSITLNIIPSVGSYISGASGCDSFSAGPGYGTCTVLMSSSRSVTFHVF